LAVDSTLVPSIPDAPARFSMMTVWPSTLAAAWHRARIVTSAVPPAGQGQMKVMARSVG